MDIMSNVVNTWSVEWNVRAPSVVSCGSTSIETKLNEKQLYNQSQIYWLSDV